VVLNTTAFIPFSAAPRSCPGKNLAMMEMRLVVALIMQGFDMKIAEGYDINKWEGSLKDYFIVKKGQLPVVLTERV
jgi:cytochrome P450